MLWTRLPARPAHSQWPPSRLPGPARRRRGTPGKQAPARNDKKREFAMSISAISVVLVGTNRLFRQGLRRLLDDEQFPAVVVISFFAYKAPKGPVDRLSR